MSLYAALRYAHYLTPGVNENDQLLGRSDIVLYHVRNTGSPDFHTVTRSFYGRALGTADYGFVTILRHPVDRYVSDYHYFVEPEAQRSGNKTSLQQYAAGGYGANRMATEFGLRDPSAAMEFAAGEMLGDGLFIPMEWLDYGLALLAVHCGWRLSQVMYLPSNSNTAGAKRFGNVVLHGRPTVEQLAQQDPALVDRIGTINNIDSILYSAAASQLLARLQPYGPAATAVTSMVMATAARLTAARWRLDADCRALHGGGMQAGLAAAPSALHGGISADDLAGLCEWYTIRDVIYEPMPSTETGRVSPNAVQPEDPTATLPSSPRTISHLVRLGDEYLAQYDNPSTPYHHSLLAVRVRPPTAVEAELVYGISGGSDSDGPLAAAVRLWTLHHAREGLHHLVFFMDSAIEIRLEQIVGKAAAAALKDGATDAAVTYTSYTIIRCSGSGSANSTATTADGCDGHTGFRDMVTRSRWSAALPGLGNYLYGIRGSVRSVLLSYEGMLHGAGAVCAPLVPWRTAPPEMPVGWAATAAAAPPVAAGRLRRRDLAAAGAAVDGDGGGGSQQATCLRTPCSLGAEDSVPCVMIHAMPLLGHTQPYRSNGQPLSPYNDQSPCTVPYGGPEHHRLEVAQLAPPSAEERGLVGQQQRPVFPCSRVPRPRVRVPWCA